MTDTTCPTCGSPVRVVTDGDTRGCTSHYEPAVADLLDGLAAWRRRAEKLARRMAEYAGCPAVNVESCPFPAGCTDQEAWACWLAVVEKADGTE